MPNSNRSLSTVMVLSLLATSVHAASLPPVSSRAMADALARTGAGPVLAELDRHPARFASILARIETADPAWLAIAKTLRSDADGADAESLDMAVARALPVAPRRVLALVDHGFELEHLCTSPFIEPEAGVAERYASRTLAALASVRDPSLRTTAARCAEHVTLRPS